MNKEMKKRRKAEKNVWKRNHNFCAAFCRLQVGWPLATHVENLTAFKTELPHCGVWGRCISFLTARFFFSQLVFLYFSVFLLRLQLDGH